MLSKIGHKNNIGILLILMSIPYLSLKKKYIQCTFQNDLLGVIVMVFNIVQY